MATKKGGHHQAWLRSTVLDVLKKWPPYNVKPVSSTTVHYGPPSITVEGGLSGTYHVSIVVPPNWKETVWGCGIASVSGRLTLAAAHVALDQVPPGADAMFKVVRVGLDFDGRILLPEPGYVIMYGGQVDFGNTPALAMEAITDKFRVSLAGEPPLPDFSKYGAGVSAATYGGTIPASSLPKAFSQPPFPVAVTGGGTV